MFVGGFGGVWDQERGPGCGLRWVLFIGDSVTRATYHKMIDFWKIRYPNSKVRLIGENVTNEKPWGDYDTIFETEGHYFKFSQRFLTSEDKKLPAILKNLTMLHGGHSHLVEPLPFLSEITPTIPASPDKIFFNLGLWPPVKWINEKENFLLKLEPVWKMLKTFVPKSKLILFTLIQIQTHPALHLPDVMRVNNYMREFAKNSTLELIDVEIITKNYTDPVFI